MLRKAISLSALCAVLAVLASLPASAQEKAETVANPHYKGWSGFKKGTTLTVEEKTTFGEAHAGVTPAAGDVKIVNYKLASVDKNKAVVLTTVVENDFLSTIESAPTRITYPAEVNKADFETAVHNLGAKMTDGKVKVLGKDLDCKVVTGTKKTAGGEVTRKISFCKEVPGGIAESITVTKQDGKVVAETVLTVKAFKAAE
jgi:hypothetical protein